MRASFAALERGSSFESPTKTPANSTGGGPRAPSAGEWPEIKQGSLCEPALLALVAVGGASSVGAAVEAAWASAG